MTLDDLFAASRDLHLEQYRSFVATQRAAVDCGGPEVKLELGDGSGLHRKLYCADFIANDGDASSIIEMTPDRVLSLEPIRTTIGDASLHIDALCWDDVVVRHDLAVAPPALDDWFDRWFDPDDVRHDAAAEFSGSIHSLVVTSNAVSLDLGTAPIDALLDMLDLLLLAGARQIEITGAR